MGGTSSAIQKDEESPPTTPISRITLGFLGVDIIILSTPKQITTALSSGDLKRLQVLLQANLQQCASLNRHLVVAPSKGLFISHCMHLLLECSCRATCSVC